MGGVPKGRSLPVSYRARICLAPRPEVHLRRATFLLRAEGKACGQGMLQRNVLQFTPQLVLPLPSPFSVSKALTSLVLGRCQ